MACGVAGVDPLLNSLTSTALRWAEADRLPDAVVRFGIRQLIRQRLASLRQAGDPAHRQRRFVEMMDGAPIALVPHKANAQHYELPPEFFTRVLGPQRKYSACFWGDGVEDLAEAEADALAQTADHAQLSDGQDILELGCGWGSLTLWMAQRYPSSQITAVSNSSPQRRFIQTLAHERGLDNVRLITADMNEFATQARFDRVVSVEMFEHMRNYRELFRRIASWLRPEGRFFMHIFCHRQHPYEFVTRDAGDWMSEHFFSGGMMPSDDLPTVFQDDLGLRETWRWNGNHYRKTALAWLRNMGRDRESIMPILSDTYGASEALCWWVRWRIFFMACVELFGYRDGREWGVSHYLFERSVP